jgi:hypothetical protein
MSIEEVPDYEYEFVEEVKGPDAAQVADSKK